MPELLLRDDDDGIERCVRCGRPAAGPCARCGASVCGDCCVLTEGGAEVWAICLACEDRGGRSIKRLWSGPLFWVLFPIGALLLIVIAIELWLR